MRGSGGRFGPLVVALEQPTHAARATVFAANTAEMLTYHQAAVETIHARDGAGWVEQDPVLILSAMLECIEVALDNLQKLDISVEDIVSVGITNQRETIVAWDAVTSRPLHNAIVWMDTRSSEIVEEFAKCGPKVLETVQSMCGLPLSTYFSAPKLCWLLRNSPNVKEAVEMGTCRVGTIDTWLIWNLTGGSKGGIYVTDVTNASRTMLMNLVTQNWDPYLCKFFQIPEKLALPKIKSSSEIYGYIFTGSLTGIPISGCLGDQQAALVGQMCLEFGQAKCTFGLGAFLLCNTGTSIIRSQHGLVTTVAYKFGPDSPTIYALEGSGIIAGVTLDWLKNELGVSDNNAEMAFNYDQIGKRSDSKPKNELLKKLSPTVEDLDPDEEGSVYFVPAFTGLYAPYWKNDARGVICGLSPNTDVSHLATAASRSIAFQTRVMLESLTNDFSPFTNRLLVDGVLATSSPLMQLQADICGMPIIRPIMPESSALGAAMAAGNAKGIQVWPRISLPPPSDIFYPTTSEDERDVMYERWNMAIKRSFSWSSKNLPIYKIKRECDTLRNNIYASLPVGLFLISSYLLLQVAKVFK